MLQLKDWVELLVFVLGLAFQSGMLYGMVKMAMKQYNDRLKSHHNRLGSHGLRIGMLERLNARHFPDEPITLPPGVDSES